MTELEQLSEIYVVMFDVESQHQPTLIDIKDAYEQGFKRAKESCIAILEAYYQIYDMDKIKELGDRKI